MFECVVSSHFFCRTPTLDEFPEFEKRFLESLREPPEEKSVGSAGDIYKMETSKDIRDRVLKARETQTKRFGG